MSYNISVDNETIQKCLNLILEISGVIDSGDIKRSPRYECGAVFVNPIVWAELQNEIAKIKVKQRRT